MILTPLLLIRTPPIVESDNSAEQPIGDSRLAVPSKSHNHAHAIGSRHENAKRLESQYLSTSYRAAALKKSRPSGGTWQTYDL